MQEYTLFQGSAHAQTVDIPAFGGKLDVSWSPESQVTQWGGLAYFVSYLKTSGLFDRLVEDAPFHYTSPNAPDVRDVVGTTVLAIVCGFTRYVHINRPRNDTVLAALLGLGRIVCEDSVRRALKSADGRELDAWLARHEKDIFDRLLSFQYVIDIDNTVKPIFGHQEGAELRRGREHVRGGKARTQEPVRLGRIRHEGSEAVPRNRTAHRHRGQLVEYLLPAGGWRQAPGTDDISSNVHGRRRTARHQRTETTPAPHVHASQGEGDPVFAHAHRRVHETNFRSCGAVGL